MVTDEEALAMEEEYKEQMRLNGKMPMTEHEEYVNADVPKEIWIERNKYLHQHIDALTDELIKLRSDNAKLVKQLNETLSQFRNKGGL